MLHKAVEREQIVQAAARIGPFVRRTPLLELDIPTPRGLRRVIAKLELLQVMGSFKPRGAFSSLLSSGATEVLACSGGNHGLAVAYAAHVLGRRATIVVPTSAAANKIATMRQLGAEVLEHGDVPGDAFVLAETLAAERGWPIVHPYDQEPVVAGQGTLGLELLEQAPQVRRWLVAVGGGGFAAGVALALGSAAELIPIEPEACPTLFAAQQAGRPVPAPASGVARNGLGPPSIGAVPWSILSTAARSVLVSDAAIVQAQRWLWREARLVAEPGGATGLAALLAGVWVPPDDAPLGLVLCGANADALP